MNERLWSHKIIDNLNNIYAHTDIPNYIGKAAKGHEEKVNLSCLGGDRAHLQTMSSLFPMFSSVASSISILHPKLYKDYSLIHLSLL